MAEGWTARLVLLVGLWVERRGPLGMAQWDEGERTRLCACGQRLCSLVTHTHTHRVGGSMELVPKKQTDVDCDRHRGCTAVNVLLYCF